MGGGEWAVTDEENPMVRLVKAFSAGGTTARRIQDTFRRVWRGKVTVADDDGMFVDEQNGRVLK